MGLNVETANRFNVRSLDNAISGRHISFKDISLSAPYINNKDVITFADLDGAFLEYGENDCWEKNIERFRSLTAIAKKSEELIFWSGRMPSDNLDFVPFITRDKMQRLGSLMEKTNPNCKVSFVCGLEKIINGGGFVQKVQEKIVDKKVVLIGSSIFDRRMVAKVQQEIKSEYKQNLYYFDTGHWIV